MTKKESALILRAIYMTDYVLDKEEELLMNDIKLKLMNIHPEQVKAKQRGKEINQILTIGLITFAILLLTITLIVSYFAM